MIIHFLDKAKYKCLSRNVILLSVSFWPLLIVESVARVSQHVLLIHGLLVKQA